jgi:hypothetical protein
MKKLSGAALIFVGAVAIGSCLIVANAVRYRQPMHVAYFLVIFALSLIASRLKLKLPGCNCNMSVNLPFILIAVVDLSLFEALMIAAASTLAQCFPIGGGRPKALQIMFNVSTVAVAVGLAGLVFQARMPLPPAWVSGPLLLSLAAASFFLAQTILVATIIRLTEGGSVLRIWSSIFRLSFPYYVLSAGVTSLVTTASHRIGWQIPLFVLPTMYGVYNSYRLYFDRAQVPARPIALAKRAAAE